VTTDPRTVAGRAARELLLALADLPSRTALRVTEAEGRLACLILVWDASRVMPAAAAERRRAGGRRAECKRDILEAIRSANRPLIRKQVLRGLKLAGRDHGYGTVAKALADLTASGELVNPKDKRGYRLPAWDREHPNLFSANEENCLQGQCSPCPKPDRPEPERSPPGS
jgi:hypothetical protein